MDPIILTSEIFDRMTEDDFFHFCQENDGLQIERNHKQEIIILPPIGAETGRIEMEIGTQLTVWNHLNGAGQTFSSSTSFSLPDGSALSPDASWVSKAKWDGLEPADKKKFAHICPEFIIELRSESDTLKRLHAKMHRWVKNGALLGWLIDPKSQKVWVYRPGQEPLEISGFSNPLSADPELPGFSLNLAALK